MQQTQATKASTHTSRPVDETTATERDADVEELLDKSDDLIDEIDDLVDEVEIESIVRAARELYLAWSSATSGCFCV